MIYTSSNLYISYLNSFSIVIIKLLWNSIIYYLTNTSVKPASKMTISYNETKHVQ